MHKSHVFGSDYATIEVMDLLARATSLLALILTAVFGASAAAQNVEHTEMCDASAVVVLEGGQLLVADDEVNTMRLYGADGQVADRFHFEDLLGTEEADIEGAARRGDVIYWVTSHGRNRRGERKWARHQLFSAIWSQQPGGIDLRFRGRSGKLARALGNPARWKQAREHEGLIRLLAKATALSQEKARRLAPQRMGLNIEALAFSPLGGLMVGLRNPLLRGKAIVVELSNPAEVVERAEEPRFEGAYLLDLGGRGLRSMVRHNQGFILVAGPVDTETDFALFSWSGSRTSVPRMMRRLPGGGGASPEGVAMSRRGLVVVYDEGARLIDGEQCKHLSADQQSFTSVRLPQVREGEQ